LAHILTLSSLSLSRHGSSVRRRSIALVIWALGAFWLFIALLSIVDTAFEGQIPFNVRSLDFPFPSFRN
jgi:hypothetical protein